MHDASFGPTVEGLGRQIEGILKDVAGTRSIYAERTAGGYFLDFDLRRDELARYGLTVQDAQMVIQCRAWPALVMLSAVGSSIPGVVLTGLVADHAGLALSTAGDVTGDGVDDLLIGAPDADPSSSRVDAGSIFVLFPGEGDRPSVERRPMVREGGPGAALRRSPGHA